MAETTAVPSGTDFSQYPNWQTVTTPSGGTYYIIPGTSWVYDPFLSAQKGRPVLWRNPQPALDEKKKQEDRIEEQGSIQNQILPVAASTVGLVGGTYLVNQIGKDSPAAKPGSSAAPTSASPKEVFVNEAVPPGTQAPATTGAAGGGVNLTPVQSVAMPDGSAGTLMQDGSIVGDNGVTILPDGTSVVGNQVQAPDGSILTGQNAQKALGYVAAVYLAYNTYKNRDQLTDEQQAAGYAQAGIAATAAAGVGTSWGAAAAPWLAGVGGALNIHGTLSNDNMTAEQQATRMQQQAGAAALDWVFGGLPVGSTLDAVLQSTSIGQKLNELDAKWNPRTALLASFGSGKSEEQMGRDKVRERLESLGVINQDGEEDWMLKFSDGTQFDLGKDGGAQLTNAAGETRQYSDVDFTDPRVGAVVGAVNPLAAILTGGNEKLRSDFAGEYTNAVLNGPDDAASVNRRLQELYSKHNINQADAIKQIDSLLENESIDNETAAAYRNGVNTVFAGTAYQGPQAAPQAQQPQLPPPGTMPPIIKPIGDPGAQGQVIANQAQPGNRLPVQQNPAQIGFTTRGAGVVQNPNPQQAAYMQVPQRTSTVSPGIGLDGKPIAWGRELARRADQRSARR